MISIDQNCHSLWDVIPKLHALAAKGHAVTQYVEDIDVAFTSMGSSVHAGALHLERERFYRSGGEDWGAALFYSEFLGRLPVEIRHWESVLGVKTDVLARHLSRPMDELYDEFSPGDTWQLIGPSYAGDNRHHRTIGDLTAAEVEDFLRQILGIAKADMLRAFPAASSVAATKEWFAGQESQLNAWLQSGAERLIDVYTRWIEKSVSGGAATARASRLFALEPGPSVELLELFTRDYDLLAGLYNQALRESQIGLRPLNTSEGELPFFGVFAHESHLVRSPARLEGRDVVIGLRSFALSPDGRLPLEAMREAGIQALPGKAIVLALQVRAGPTGQPLALPFGGSIYMPAAFVLERLLRDRGLLEHPVQPVVRVRFHFLGRLREIGTIIRLPEHLQPYFGRRDVPAMDLGNEWRAIQSQARERLEKFHDAAYHLDWARQTLPDLAQEISRLDVRRRELAAIDSKDPQLRLLWKALKPLQTRQLEATVRQVARDWQAARIDFYDSRGAIWPWCVALGGQDFYQHVIQEAEIYEERA
jgi:hypothetical protein